MSQRVRLVSHGYIDVLFRQILFISCRACSTCLGNGRTCRRRDSGGPGALRQGPDGAGRVRFVRELGGLAPIRSRSWASGPHTGQAASGPASPCFALLFRSVVHQPLCPTHPVLVWPVSRGVTQGSECPNSKNFVSGVHKSNSRHQSWSACCVPRLEVDTGYIVGASPRWGPGGPPWLGPQMVKWQGWNLHLVLLT